MPRPRWALLLAAAAVPAVRALPPPGAEVQGCPDVAPDTAYSCEQQKSWGKCSQSFMVGHCCQTCFQCAPGCGGPAPPPRPSCADQAIAPQPSSGPISQALFQKLAAVWTSRSVTLSGHTGGPKGSDYENSYEEMTATVGKHPAVKAYDFQNYSPHNPWHPDWSSWDDNSVSEAIAWYQSTGGKGIVSFEWHWFSPMGGNLSTSTFYSKNTNFDTAKAVVPGTAENAATVRDLNAIATQLRRLKDAGVPVVWRPLHEASGNQWGAWFWWGRAGPEVCHQLLDMMRDVFINQHGLDNLVWVWSDPNPKWYPGNDKIDVVGYDSYPGAYNYDCNGDMWNQLLSMTNCQKMLALTEVGPIPNVDTCYSQGIRWLYFLTWGSLGKSQNTDQHLHDVYNSAHVRSVENLASDASVVV